MRYLKKMNEGRLGKKPIPPKYPNKVEIADSLKDALTELTDSKQVYVSELLINDPKHPRICICIKLDHQYNEFNLWDKAVDLDDVNKLDISRLKKGNEEIEEILSLFKEAVERSQMDYKSIKFGLTLDYWSDYNNDNVGDFIEGENECDILEITIEVK